MAAKEAADRECIGQMPRILGQKTGILPCVMQTDARKSVVPARRKTAFAQNKSRGERK
jgi:hypothetical protein